MKKIKIRYFAIISIIFSIIMVGIFAHTIQASAANDYYFVFNNQSLQVGKQAELKTKTALLNVSSQTSSSAKVVQWISSAPEIISLKTTPYGDKFIQLNRERPGYSTITAVFDDGFMVNCVIKVNLAFDYQKTTGVITSTTTKERIMVFDNVGEQRTIYVKYVDDQDTNTPGEAIDASFVDWESSDVGVIKVDAKGKVTAVGAGSATITVSTFTMSTTDTPMTISMRVVVAPRFSLSLVNDTGGTEVYYSSDNYNSTPTIVNNVPSEFVLESNATIGQNLKWVIYDSTGGKKKVIPEGESSKMTYSISKISGNVQVSNIKAGTYEVFAFANDSYNENTNCPYAYMKLVVPLRLPDKNIVLNVNDTYSLLDNTNIPSVGVFGTPIYKVGNANIAKFDASNYVITAKSRGEVTLQLEYNPATKLFDSAMIIPPFNINITVVDNIGLNMTIAKIFTGGKLLLDAIVTDPTVEVTWLSDNTSIATVKDGLVTGVKPGEVRITAQQIIKGVKKTATCVITVQQSVISVTLTPNKGNLGIGDFLTIHATIKPTDLKNVKLTWQSSDTSVVEIVDPDEANKSATIQAKAGGNAVVAAINQDNVVVGYAHITVKQPVTGLTLSETSAVVDLAMERIQLRATISPENATDQTVTWRSTDSSKAKVDANGSVTLLKPGTVTIIATSKDNAKVYADCNLTILVPAASIELLETSKIMYAGNRDQLKYNLLPEDTSNKKVTWISTNPSAVTVDGLGKITAKGVGFSVILLKAEDGGLSTYCTIQVKQAATAMKFDKNVLNLMVGKFDFIKPTFTPANCTETNLDWKSSDEKVAKIDISGRVTALSAGTTYITATTDNGKFAMCRVVVTQSVTGVSIVPESKAIYKGQKFQLTATVAPKNASNKNITWKSSNTKVATVTSNGEVKGIIGGVAIITCTTVDGNYVDACVVTVKELVTSVKLNYSSYKLGLKKTIKLTATVTNQTATNKNVKWTSSNSKIATVDSKGKVTAKALGSVTITATALDGSKEDATCDIRVVREVTSISLNKGSMSLYVGSRQTLKATIKPTNATYKTPNWKSSNTSVATVDSSGVVTALKAGTALITASAQDNSGKKAICYLTVNNRIPATGVTVQDTEITMVEGEKKSVQIALIPSTSSDGVKWSSNNSSVASVDKSSGMITAKSSGSANITVMTDSGKKATITVTVIGLNVTSLVTEQYTTYKQALSVEGAKTKIKWSSQNQKIVEVYSDGTISTRGPGTTTVTALINGKKLKCKITVQKLAVKKKTTATAKKKTTTAKKK